MSEQKQSVTCQEISRRIKNILLTTVINNQYFFRFIKRDFKDVEDENLDLNNITNH
jgi:hypothetical protein